MNRTIVGYTTALIMVIAVAPLAASGLPRGDPARGEQIYSRCFACHAIDRDRTGPRHAGLFGRRAGSIADFQYSAAMRKAGVNGLVWTEASLDSFLKDPASVVPGTRMGYAGVKDDQERADLIAYLNKATMR
jgi:cytochrome c